MTPRIAQQDLNERGEEDNEATETIEKIGEEIMSSPENKIVPSNDKSSSSMSEKVALKDESAGNDGNGNVDVDVNVNVNVNVGRSGGGDGGDGSGNENGSRSGNNSSSNSSGSSSNNSSKPGGYSADCSSLSNGSASDCSSDYISNDNRNDSPSKPNALNSAISRQMEQQKVLSNLSHSHNHGHNLSHSHNHGHGHGHGKPSFHSLASSFMPVSGSSSNKRSQQKRVRRKNLNRTLPQWQGVRVVNPMDPRIDLSSVGVIPASSLYASQQNGHADPEDQNTRIRMPQTCQSQAQVEHEQSPTESSDECKKNALLSQYTDLMNSLEVSSSIQALSDVNLPQEATLSSIQDFDRANIEQEPPPVADGSEDGKSYSSMVVLARVKRKCQKDDIDPQQQANPNPNPDIIQTQTDAQDKSDRTDLLITVNNSHPLPSGIEVPPNAKNDPLNPPSSLNDSHDSPDGLSSSVSSQSIAKKNAAFVTDSMGVSGSTVSRSTGSGGTNSTGSDRGRNESNSDNFKPGNRARSSTTTRDKNINIEMSTEDAEAATQERLALKKRKRLDKRREYEEVQRQLQESSDSSSGEVGGVFKVGSMISMEDALSFANSARLIVQAFPPFYAVHVNAAFSRLTGMQNSGTIGRPLSKIISILEINDWGSSSLKDDKPPITSSKFGDEPTEAQIDENGLLIKKLIGSCGFGCCHVVTTIDDKYDDKNGNTSNSTNNSSLTSKEDSFTPMKCVMSICAIVSPANRGRNSSKHKKQEVHNIQEQPNHPSGYDPAKKLKREQGALTKSHCLIQLTPCEDSFNSIEEKANGIEGAVQGDQEEDNNCNSGGSESSSSHAVACG